MYNGTSHCTVFPPHRYNRHEFPQADTDNSKMQKNEGIISFEFLLHLFLIYYYYYYYYCDIFDSSIFTAVFNGYFCEKLRNPIEYISP